MKHNIKDYQAKCSKEELSANARKAGTISGKNRRERRLLRDTLSTLLETKTDSGDVSLDICQSLILRALKGDVRAFEVIRDTCGEKPKDKINIETNDVINIKIDGKDKS